MTLVALMVIMAILIVLPAYIIYAIVTDPQLLTYAITIILIGLWIRSE